GCGSRGSPAPCRSSGSRCRARSSSSAASSARRSVDALAPGRFVYRRAVAERLPPLAVVRAPGARLRDPALPGDLVPPAELLADLRRVEQVAPVVAGTV